jgi:hypothetical protein
MEQCSGPLEVEIVPRKHCDFSHYLAKGTGAQSGACAEVQFPDYGTELCSLVVEMVPGKHCHFSTYFAKRARARSGACAEVQFPDYETMLWSPGIRNFSRKAGKHCDFSTYLTRERELSLSQAQRCSFLIIEQCCGPLPVEMVPGKHCYFRT